MSPMSDHGRNASGLMTSVSRSAPGRPIQPAMIAPYSQAAGMLVAPNQGAASSQKPKVWAASGILSSAGYSTRKFADVGPTACGTGIACRSAEHEATRLSEGCQFADVVIRPNLRTSVRVAHPILTHIIDGAPWPELHTEMMNAEARVHAMRMRLGLSTRSCCCR